MLLGGLGCDGELELGDLLLERSDAPLGLQPDGQQGRYGDERRQVSRRHVQQRRQVDDGEDLQTGSTSTESARLSASSASARLAAVARRTR